MNKVLGFFSFIIIFLLAVSSVSAIAVYEVWEDGSTIDRIFEQGEIFSFDYVTMGYDYEVMTTEVFLLDYINFATPLELLENTTQTGSYYDTLTYDTQNLENGDYILYAKATSQTFGIVAFDLLNFTIENATTNTEPVWSNNLQLDYSFNILTTPVSVVNFSNHIFDAEGDDITFILDETNTNASILDCWLEGGDYLICDLTGLGTTTIEVIAFDGELYSEPVTITIEVWEFVNSNTEPYWSDNLELNYEYNLSEGFVQVVNLSDYALDDDSLDLFISLDTSSINSTVVTCGLIDEEILACNLMGLGTTSLDAFIFDGELFSLPANITITVLDDIQQNHEPYFYNMSTIYLTTLGVQDIFDFELHTADVDNDTLTYEFYSSSDTDVIQTCAVIMDHILRCTIVGDGNTELLVSVADDEFTVYENMSVTVQSNTPVNTAPYWDSFIASYSYWLGLEYVQVLKLNDVITDDENDSLTFSLDESNTNMAVVDCKLVGSGASENNSGVWIDSYSENSNTLFTNNILLSIRNFLGFDSSRTNTHPPFTTFATYLVCDLNGVGATTVDIFADDGDLSSNALTVHLNVWDNATPNTPPYYNDIVTQFSYWLGLGNVDVLNLSNTFFDAENDPLTFLMNNVSTDPSVVTCDITADDLLHCDLVGVGTTSLDLYAYDGEFYSRALTVTITVWDNATNNTAPYWNESMQLEYTVNIDLIEVDLVDLVDYAIDDENDALTFVISDSFPSGIVGCSLVNETSLHCQLLFVGTTYLKAHVSDGELGTSIELKINVVENIPTYDQPIAVITAPLTAHPDELIYFDAYASYVDPALSIVSYDWVLTNPSGVLTYFNGSLQHHTFAQAGLYYLRLTIVDSIGQSSSALHVFTVLPGDVVDNSNSLERGLKIRSYGVYGYDFERAYIGGDLVIIAVVENIAEEDLKDIRMTFTIPEFGIRMKSDSFDLDKGDQKTVSILGFVPDFLDAGVYYPYYSFSDDEIRRVKTGYLEITN